MSTISANDLKIKGIAALEAATADAREAIISVRGKPRFVVLDIAHYEALREAELLVAWQEARNSTTQGDAMSESAAEHIARLRKEHG